MKDRPTLFLDVDGVLLGHPERGSSVYQLANHGLAFLRFALARFQVAWATTHCRHGDSRPVVDYLGDHARNEAERDRLTELAMQVRPTAFNVCKTEMILRHPNDQWVWIDDAPLASEIEALRAEGCHDQLLRVNTCRQPDDLRRAMRDLRSLLELEN